MHKATLEIEDIIHPEWNKYVSEMEYSFFIGEDGSGYVTHHISGIEDHAGVFDNRDDMLEFISVLCTSYPRVILNFHLWTDGIQLMYDGQSH